MYANRTLWTAAVLLLFIATVTSVTIHGRNNRSFAPGRITTTVNSPEKAYAIWQENKVKGRILILFDAYPHAGGLVSYDAPPRLSLSNLVEFGIFKNVIRKIYLIVPDPQWEGFLNQKGIIPLRQLPGAEKGLYLYNLNGVPFTAVTPSSLPHLGEEVLVYVNGRLFTVEEAERLLREKRITSDLFITCQQWARP